MSSPGASTPADASTLGTSTLFVTALNVGMNAEENFKASQSSLMRKLAQDIMTWLDVPGAAAVALNEIHSNIAEKLMKELHERAPAWRIQKATSLSNSLLWRAPQ